jgi:hypothetical protein
MRFRLLVVLASFVCFGVAAAPDTAKPLSEHEYQEDLDAKVWHQQRGRRFIGYLDAAGNFYPDPKRIPNNGYRLEAAWFGESARWTNAPFRDPEETVYEYRSGRLIKGVMKKNGDFVPDFGSTVIPFADYKYSKTASRIYNLPGRFVEKQQDVQTP